MADSNVPTGVYRPQNITDFPALYWDADGKATLYKSAGEVPAGSTPYSPADKAKVAAAKTDKRAPAPTATPAPEPSVETAVKIPPRAEIVAALQERNVKFNAQSPTRALYELLLSYAEANE